MAGRLLILFIALPLLETWLLIKVGSAIGALWTIVLIIATAVVGSQLVRRQGLGVMQRLREHQARGEAPAVPMLEGAALLLAGFFLIMPGFITDTLGFLMLVPPLRAWVARRLLARAVTVQAGVYGAPRPGQPPSSGGKSRDANVIEGDYEREDRPNGDR